MDNDLVAQLLEILRRQQQAGSGAPSYGGNQWQSDSLFNPWAQLRPAPTLSQLSLKPGAAFFQPENLSWSPGRNIPGVGELSSRPGRNLWDPSATSWKPGGNIPSLGSLTNPATSSAYDPSEISTQAGTQDRRRIGWSL
jgi:hypothetical protein